MAQKTTCHRDGTITYWSVYFQEWMEGVDDIPDRELAAMNGKERDRVIRHLGLEPLSCLEGVQVVLR